MKIFKILSQVTVMSLLVFLISPVLVYAAPPVPVHDYWFDECKWDGTAGEVLDHTGSNNGTSENGAYTTDQEKVVYRGAYFDGSDDYVQAGANFSALKGDKASLSFWIKTTQTGNAIDWQAPGVTGVEDKGTQNDIFWGWLDDNGKIGIAVGDNNGDNYAAKSDDPINDGAWHHIVITRDATTNAGRVYVDGSFSGNATLKSYTLNPDFSSIGRIEDTGGTPAYFQGYLDEVEIYDSILSAQDVADIYNSEKTGHKNYDGTERNAPNCVNLDGNLVAEYRMDECGFDGTPRDVIDNTINRIHGTSHNGVYIVSFGKVCSAAGFNGTDGYIKVADNQKLDITGSMTVSLWVYPTRSNTDEYYVSKYDGEDGWRVWFNKRNWGANRIQFNLVLDGNNRRVYVNEPSGWTNNWHMVTAVYDSNQGMMLYIDGSLVDSNNRKDTIDTTSEPLYIGVRGDTDTNYFRGGLDEVKIWKRALTDTEVSNIYNNEYAGRNWNETSATRVCNTCFCTAEDGNSYLVSLASDFRHMTTGKTVTDKLGDDFGSGLGNTWQVVRRDYDVGAPPNGNNDAHYTYLTGSDDLEYGKAYWIRNDTGASVTWESVLKTMDFDATVQDYPSCQSANGKCIIVDLVEPNGTDNHGPYIYTMTSFPILKTIKWKDVRVLIDNVAYTPDGAAALDRVFNATIWKYDQAGNSYTEVTPDTPGTPHEIEPCRGYWIELDKGAYGHDVKLLIPQE